MILQLSLGIMAVIIARIETLFINDLIYLHTVEDRSRIVYHDSLPPLIGHCNGKYYILDGHHRVEGKKQLKEGVIKCFVIDVDIGLNKLPLFLEELDKDVYVAYEPLRL